MSNSTFDAYLDIETTGLSPVYNEITVIGICLVNGSDCRLVQLVGEQVTLENLVQALNRVHTIHTYNGRRFDLPFIRACLDVDLAEMHNHRDLMYDCWHKNLYGGFKAVEAQLGIPRKLKGINGYDAVMLWRRFQQHGDRAALALLLEYNREDVMNLKILREKLLRISKYLEYYEGLNGLLST